MARNRTRTRDVLSSPNAVVEIDPERWAALPCGARAALLRSDLFRAVGWAFLYPEASLLRALWQTIEGIASRSSDVTTHAATVAALDELHHFNRSSVQQLSLHSDRIFGHTISAECPPYETQYGAGIIFAQTQRMGDITAF